MAEKSVQEYMALPYARVLVPDEGGGYFAEVLELSGCFADGNTPDETMSRLDASMEAWFETAIEMGKPIPEPLETQDYSGKLVLRMPVSIHGEAVRRAQAEGVSLNQWILAAIGERLGAEGFSEHLVAKVRFVLRVQGQLELTSNVHTGAADPVLVWPKELPAGQAFSRRPEWIARTIRHSEGRVR